MENLISIENLIESAKKKGIDFGKGDPYNRLRYYTKIGWLPHMIRKVGDKGGIKGHYPEWALGQLVLIEQLKSKGASNEAIAKKIQVRNKFQGLINLVNSKESRSQFVTYLILFSVLIILANQFEILNLGRPKSQLKSANIDPLQTTVQIVDNGTSFIPKNQNIVFVKSPNARTGMQVNVTFRQNYSPATRYWVSEIRDYNGFVLELDAPVSANAEFVWWLSY